MNNKTNTLYLIVDAVVDCCKLEVNGIITITRGQVIGKCKKENAVMTRCILVHQLISAGYSTETISVLLGRSVQGINKLVSLGYELLKTSKAYRIANAEATLRCKDISI